MFSPRVAIASCLLICGGAAAAVAEDAPNDSPDTVLVTGRVTDEDGAPIAGATVERPNPQRRFELRERVTTDANGFYRMRVPNGAGWLLLAASAPGRQTLASMLDRKPGDLGRDFRLAPIDEHADAVAGTVVDKQGKPIAGVRVEAYTPLVGHHSSFSMPTGREYFPGPDRVAVTDAEGRFRIADIPSAEVRLNLDARHRHVNEKNYATTEGLVIRMRGSGEPGVLQGRLVNAATGEPIGSPPEVRIVRRHRTDVLRVVDEQGRFRLPGKPTLGNRYALYVYVAGFAATEARTSAVAADSDEYAEIRLTPAAPLRVRLVDDSSGEPIPGARLLYGLTGDTHYFQWSDFSKYTDGYHGFDFVQQALSDAEGELWFAEPADGARGAIFGTADGGYERIVLGPDSRTFDEATGQLVIRVRRESVIHGVIFNGEAPLPGARVTFARDKLLGLEMWFPGVTTDAEGRYRIGGLAPGPYRVWANGCFRRQEVGESETVEVTMGADAGPLTIHGAAPAGATITLRPKFDWEYQTLTAEADETGSYVLSGVKQGEYNAQVLRWRRGFRQRRKSVIVVERQGQRFDFGWAPAKPKDRPKPPGRVGQI